MIDDLDRSLRNLLAKELPEIQRGDVEVSFNQPDSEWSARLGNKPTLNIFLYDIRENAPLRQHTWQQVENGPNGNEHKVLFKRSPLRMDCFYLVSAWSPADAHTRAYEEHRLLSQAMLALARYPILNLADDQPMDGRRVVTLQKNGNHNGQINGHSYLAGQLVNHEHEVRTRVANHDVMTNPAELWSALENKIRAAFSYVVTLSLEPWANQPQEAGEVGTVTIDTGQAPRPPEPTVMDEAKAPSTAAAPSKRAETESGATSTTLVNVGGTVRDQAKQLQPVAEMKVTLMEPDLFNNVKNIGLFKEAITDENGRFRFRRLPPGDFVLVVGADLDSPLATKQITVSSGADESTAARDGYAELVIGQDNQKRKASKSRQK